MKVRGILAVMVLSAATMWAQAAPAAQAQTPAAPAATDNAAKPADHAACMHGKDAKMGCCKRDKDGKMSGKMGCCKKGKCARHKNASATTSDTKS